MDVVKDLTIRGRLSVEQYTNNNIINTTTTDYTHITTEDLSVNGNISISDNVTINNVLTVNGISTINGTLNTNGAHELYIQAIWCIRALHGTNVLHTSGTCNQVSAHECKQISAHEWLSCTYNSRYTRVVHTTKLCFLSFFFHIAAHGVKAAST